VVGSGKGHWIEIYGGRKTLVFGSNNLVDYGRGYEVYIGEKGKTRMRRIPIPLAMRFKTRFSDGRVAPFHRLAERFIDAVQTHSSSPSPSFKEGYRAQLLMDLAMKADEERCWVQVPPVQHKET
jgi:predicted dehydrogenase